MPKKFKIFLDSSALISGLNSPSGGAGIIIAAFFAGEFFVYISEQVIEEVQQNISIKFPLLKNAFFNFLLAQPKVVKQLSFQEIKKAHDLIHTKDAPIMAAAIKSNPDFLITWDTKHFLKREVVSKVPFTICTPEQFLKRYWKKK